MKPLQSTAIAHPNIAFVKYWGDRNQALHIPASGSISMNLAGLFSQTTVSFDTSIPRDDVTFNDTPASPQFSARVTRFLDCVRYLAGKHMNARVKSSNNFPTGAGIASSASGFAALALAASKAVGLNLNETALSRLARLGSGSACRSIPGGFVEWFPGEDDESSYATSIAPPQHWDLVDCIAVIDISEKPIDSLTGHYLASTSPLQSARIATASKRLDACRSAIQNRDFDNLADVVELESNLLHAVMMTSSPPLFYWLPASLELMQAIPGWRKTGLPVCYTLDAGPNVHVLCEATSAGKVLSALDGMPGLMQVYSAPVGGAAILMQ